VADVWLVKAEATDATITCENESEMFIRPSYDKDLSKHLCNPNLMLKVNDNLTWYVHTESIISEVSYVYIGQNRALKSAKTRE